MSAIGPSSAAASADNGVPTGYLKIVSGDHHVFVLEKRIAIISGFIRAMLASPKYVESEGTVTFPDISGATMEKVIQFMHYKKKISEMKPTGPGGSQNIPEFPVATEEAMKLLEAANYLDL